MDFKQVSKPCCQAQQLNANTVLVPDVHSDASSVCCVLQLMMHSRALEITVEECMSYPLSWDNSSNLQQLFGTFLPRADAQVLATSVIRLAQLLAEDTQSYDTLGAAQRAVRDVIAALKVAKEEKGDTTGSRLTSTFNRLDKIDQEINRQQTFLQKIAQTGGSISR